tara:strand:- start:862 stop:1038 length:177 start_codon:yes stop_codon:yes gene_type:complete
MGASLLGVILNILVREDGEWDTPGRSGLYPVLATEGEVIEVDDLLGTLMILLGAGEQV